MRWDVGHGLGKLVIKNSGASDGVVILATPTKKPRAKAAIYVRGKSTALVPSIPDGGFHIYCVLGNGWSPKLKRFVAVHSCEVFWDDGFDDTYYFDFDTTQITGGIVYCKYTICLTRSAGSVARPMEVQEKELPSLD